MNSIEEVKNIPVSTTSGGTTLLLRNIANVQNSVAAAEYDRFNSQRMITLTANISGADLGSVASQLTTAMKRAGAPPAKVNSEIRGQIVPFRQMFTGLEAGLLLAVVVIFLLLAANYQSWKLAFVVTSTAPAVIAGVAIALWVTRTTLNIQSFMGAIMATGVAVANAILLVTFAERARVGQPSRLSLEFPGAVKKKPEATASSAPTEAGGTPALLSAADAAVEGAQSRLRPILM